MIYRTLVAATIPVVAALLLSGNAYGLSISEEQVSRTATRGNSEFAADNDSGNGNKKPDSTEENTSDEKTSSPESQQKEETSKDKKASPEHRTDGKCGTGKCGSGR